MLVFPDRDINQCENVHEEVSAVSILQNVKNLADDQFLSEDHFVKSCNQESILKENIVSMHHAEDEQVLIKEVTVITHICNGNSVMVMGK